MICKNMKYAKVTACIGVLFLTTSLYNQAQAKGKIYLMIEEGGQDPKKASKAALKANTRDISRELEGQNLIGPKKSTAPTPKNDWKGNKPMGKDHNGKINLEDYFKKHPEFLSHASKQLSGKSLFNHDQ